MRTTSMMSALVLYRRAALMLCALACGASGAFAQDVRFTRLVDENFGSIRLNPYGNRPALQGGHVACLADYAGQLSAGVFRVAADGGGQVTVIADETTVMPNRPGLKFRIFENPDIFGGTVVFTGGRSTDINDGIYTGDGGPVAAYHDRLTEGVPPFAPSIGEDGVAFQHDPSFGDTPFFKRPGQASFALALRSAPAPGGGVFQIFDLPYMPAYGGKIVTFPAYIDHPTPGGDGGVYAHDLATDTLHVVANPDNVMPGTGLNFEFFSTAATDGERVAFIGHHGNPGFGGVVGIFVAPAISDGAGPITKVAVTGEAAPGGGTFVNFGPIAIDDDLVAFSAQTAHTADFGLYFARLNGSGGPPTLTRVLNEGDVLEGGAVAAWSFIHQSLDAGRLVVRVTYDAPAQPYFHYGLYLIELVGPADCPADFSADGVVDFADYLQFLNLYDGLDPRADLTSDGLIDFADYLEFLNLYEDAC